MGGSEGAYKSWTVPQCGNDEGLPCKRQPTRTRVDDRPDRGGVEKSVLLDGALGLPGGPEAARDREKR